MKNKGIIIGILIVLVGIGGYFAWKQNLNTPKEKEVVKIGVIMPQTGFLASPGQNVIKGIELYFNEFNQKYPGHKVQLVIEDSKSETKVGVNAINKLISTDRIRIIIGDLASPIFLAMAPIAEKNKVVMISPGASNPAVRNAGDYIFRDYPSDEFDGKIMAKYMRDEKGVKKTAVAYFNNDYGIGLKDAFVKEYEKNGTEISLLKSFDDNNLDFKTLILQLKRSNSKNIYFIGSPKQSAYFLKQLKEQNLHIKVFGNLGIEDKEFINIARNSFDSVVYSAPYFDVNRKDKKMVDFLKTYHNSYNENADLTAALGYDVASIIGFCLIKTNFNVNNIKDELYQVQRFNGLTGNTSFDDKGDVIKEISIKKINGKGNIHILKTIE